MYLSNNLQEFTAKLSDYDVTKLVHGCYPSQDDGDDLDDYYYHGCCKLVNLSFTLPSPSFTTTNTGFGDGPLLATTHVINKSKKTTKKFKL